MKISKYVFTTILLFSFLLNSCDLDVSNPNSPTDDDLNSYSGMALIGVGLQKRMSAAVGNYSLLTGCVSGELSPIIGYLHLQPLRKYPDASKRIEFTPDNDDVRLAWREQYAIVKSANDILENTPSIDMDQETRNGMIALAKAGKALAFYQLITQWQKIPIATGVDHPEFADRAAVIEASLELLEDAEVKSQNVSESFTNDVLATGMDITNLARALQARLYLMKGDYPKAAEKANQVTAEAFYVYDEQSKNPFYTTYIASNFFEALAYWVEDAEEGDLRVPARVDTATRGGHYGSDTTYMIIKYDDPADIIPIYTMNEMTLIKAEAYARGGGGDPVAEVNKIRADAGLPPYSGANALAEVFKQRFYDLFATGQNWEDLRRFRNDGVALVDEIRDRELYHEWFIYPDYEADKNPNVPAQPTEINYGY